MMWRGLIVGISNGLDTLNACHGSAKSVLCITLCLRVRDKEQETRNMLATKGLYFIPVIVIRVRTIPIIIARRKGDDSVLCFICNSGTIERY